MIFPTSFYLQCSFGFVVYSYHHLGYIDFNFGFGVVGCCIIISWSTDFLSFHITGSVIDCIIVGCYNSVSHHQSLNFLHQSLLYYKYFSDYATSYSKTPDSNSNSKTLIKKSVYIIRIA